MPAAAIVRVEARRWWTDSGLVIHAGDRLIISAQGAWTDGSRRCGPDGYEDARLQWARPLRRLPAAPWFSLIAGIGRGPGGRFLAGAACERLADRSGRLWFFANDVPLMYWNNSGIIEARIAVERGAI